jgi:hypothetical protein
MVAELVPNVAALDADEDELIGDGMQPAYVSVQSGDVSGGIDGRRF